VAQRVITDPVVLRILEGTARIDHTLPSWARRNNPIVRRQLGIYWKTLPLDIGLWLRLLLFQAGSVLLAIPFPVLYSLIMPVVTVSVLLLPMVFILYVQVLYGITSLSVNAIVYEQRNGTLDMLMVTPLPRNHILFSKVAASIWRQLDNLNLVIAAHVLLSIPIIILQYASSFSPSDEPALTAFAIVLGLAAYTVRLFLEPVMVGSVGLMIGTIVSPRIVALLVAMTLNVSYFFFINLPRLLDLSYSVRLLVEIALPLIVPVVVTWVALSIAAHVIQRD
jgi:ABC-type transport system involved in multi-copper enzyme maturation permease subunit